MMSIPISRFFVVSSTSLGPVETLKAVIKKYLRIRHQREGSKDYKQKCELPNLVAPRSLRVYDQVLLRKCLFNLTILVLDVFACILVSHVILKNDHHELLVVLTIQVRVKAYPVAKNGFMIPL